MERKVEEGKTKEMEQSHQPPYISPMQPMTRGAYGGGMYGTEQGQTKKPEKPSASETQSADGPDEARNKPKHKTPLSSGDRDIDITGQSYIQELMLYAFFFLGYYWQAVKFTKRTDINFQELIVGRKQQQVAPTGPNPSRPG